MAKRTDGMEPPVPREGGNSKPDMAPPTLRIHEPEEEPSSGESGSRDAPAQVPRAVIVIEPNRIRITIRT